MLSVSLAPSRPRSHYMLPPSHTHTHPAPSACHVPSTRNTHPPNARSDVRRLGLRGAASLGAALPAPHHVHPVDCQRLVHHLCRGACPASDQGLRLTRVASATRAAASTRPSDPPRSPSRTRAPRAARLHSNHTDATPMPYHGTHVG
eukprot:3124633-Prymnesium_polylepis.1